MSFYLHNGYNSRRTMGNEQRKISFPLLREGTDCHRMLFKVKPEDISYVVNITECYDSVGVARTVDQLDGIVEILVAPDYIEDAKSLIRALEKDVDLFVIRL